MTTSRYSVKTSPLSFFFFFSTKSSAFWLLVRLYVGWEWLSAGWEKLQNATWVGNLAGQSLTGFVQGALTKAGGAHPAVQSWYATFLEQVVLSHPVFWSYLVTWGEILVGLALILGFLVGVSAFFGFFMNLNYLLAGTVSTNPILLVLGVVLILSWRVAGYYGLDRYVLPKLHSSFHPTQQSL